MGKPIDEAIKRMAEQCQKRQEEALKQIMYKGIPIKVDESLDDDDFRPIIGSWMNAPVMPVHPYGVVCNVAMDDDYCDHRFVCDYESAFIKKKYYSCKKCGKKQEDL